MMTTRRPYRPQFPPILLGACLLSASASAAPLGLGGAGSGAATANTQAPDTPTPAKSLCEETWTGDRARPTLKESFPTRGTAGHILELSVEVEHLPGERVLPSGLTLKVDSPEQEALSDAQFSLVEPSSAFQPVVTRSEEGKVVTQVTLPLIALPKTAGRHLLTLPSLPISISRASGHLQVLCTRTHTIQIEDSWASQNSPQLRPDPDPRPQREIWMAARNAVLSLLIALPIAALILFLFIKLRRKFRRPEKGPPPRPAWEIALSELDSPETRALFEKDEYEAHLDRVVDVLRAYLGQRYGFEGLESTTRELLRQLSSRAPDFPEEIAVRSLLQRTDLVKFARSLPTPDECQDAVAQVRAIVMSTRPRVALDPRAESKDSRAAESKAKEAPR